MAFKVLDEKQMDLFTDAQKKQYEEALERYRERAAFVERMDALENIELPLYEPRLREIALIGEIPEKDYAAPEYAIKTCVPIAGPKPRFHTLELGGPISATLPQYSKAVKVEVGHIKKAEAARPQLPETVKVEKVVIKVDFTKREKPGIPDIAAPDVLTVLPEKLEKVEAILPMVAICFTNIKEYKKPELTPNQKPRCRQRGIRLAVLQNAMHPREPLVFKPRGMCQINADTSAWHIARGNIVPSCMKFTKPELSRAKLPKMVRLKHPVHEFASVEYSVSDLSLVKGQRVEIRKERSFAYEGRGRKPQLPAVEKPNVSNVVFKPVKAAESKITVAPISPVRVKPFAKVESKAGQMPGVVPVAIPDAGKRLKELFTAKEEHEGLEGNSS
ncbi:MAG: hypothetical protein NC126_03215 [Clostridium sp.]|nr:hypothetical protein [Clostridium sp.]